MEKNEFEQFEESNQLPEDVALENVSVSEIIVPRELNEEERGELRALLQQLVN